MDDTNEAVNSTEGTVVKTEVDPKIIEIETSRQKLEAERKEFEAQRKAWEAERTKPATEERTDYSFSFDDAFENPLEYFKAKHGLDDTQVMDLVQSVLYQKFPDKKPPGWENKLTQHQMKKLRKEMDAREAKAKAEAESQAAQEYGARIQREFELAADDWEKADYDSSPYTKAFFESKDEYLGALINIAATVAGEKKQVPTITEVKEALDKWLEKRYTRFKPKQAENKSVEAAVEQVMAKSEDANTLTVKPPAGTPDKPMTAEERYKKALERVAGQSFTKK